MMNFRKIKPQSENLSQDFQIEALIIQESVIGQAVQYSDRGQKDARLMTFRD